MSTCNTNHNHFSLRMWFNNYISFNAHITSNIPIDGRWFRRGQGCLGSQSSTKKPFRGSCKQCIDATHWTQLPTSTICGQLRGTEMEFTRLVFWNQNRKTFSARAQSLLARLRWDRVENMSGEMKLTPTFHFCPPPAPHRSFRAQSRRHFFGKVEENIPLTVDMESLQLLSLFMSLYFYHLSSLWFIVILHSLSGVQCLHFLSRYAHTILCTRTHTHTCILRHFSLSSTLSLLLLVPSLPLLLSSMGWNLGCIGMSPFITPPFVRWI